MRPPALDPCHRQRQLIAVSSSNASTGHVAAAAAVSANSSTAARPLLVCLRGQTQRSSALGKLFCSTSLSSGSSGLGKLFCSTTFVGLHARANRAAAYLSSISSLLDTNRNSIRSTSLRQQRSWQAPLQHDLCWSACAGKPEHQRLSSISSQMAY